MSYSKWLNPHDEQKEARRYTYPYYELKEVDYGQKELFDLLEALEDEDYEGASRIVDYAFIWATTPQGATYWNHKTSYDEEESYTDYWYPEDLIFIRELAEVARGERTA